MMSGIAVSAAAVSQPAVSQQSASSQHTVSASCVSVGGSVRGRRSTTTLVSRVSFRYSLVVCIASPVCARVVSADCQGRQGAR